MTTKGNGRSHLSPNEALEQIDGLLAHRGTYPDMEVLAEVAAILVDAGYVIENYEGPTDD